MATWRYIAQRATTGEFLDFEVPFLTRSELSWSLSAAGFLKGTVPSGVATMTAPDGRPLFEEWNTLLYAEADGEIRWGGIVIRSEIKGDAWNIEAATFATYPHGIPFLDEYYAAETDPADIIRLIWQHVQGFDSGNLGVVVTGQTPVKVGSKSESVANAAATAYSNAKTAYETERDKYTQLRDLATEASSTLTAKRRDLTNAKAALTEAKETKNPTQIAAAQNQVNAAQDAVNSAQATYDTRNAAAKTQADVRDRAKAAQDAANDRKKAATKDMKEDGGAYKLLWWEAPDCGDAIAKLAKDVPFDFTERHAWAANKTAITHEISVQYPRAGRRRDDLAFIVGDNITSQPEPQSNGDDFANTVFGLGNGEGPDMLQTTAANDDGRLRRVNVLSSKDTKILSTLQAQTRNELLKAASGLSIGKVTVRDHMNAPIGSWDLGDDILIQAEIPFLGRIALWHRIVAWTLTSDSTATLSLERSESFTYGK